jgi:hypothetical protein
MRPIQESKIMPIDYYGLFETSVFLIGSSYNIELTMLECHYYILYVKGKSSTAFFIICCKSCLGSHCSMIPHNRIWRRMTRDKLYELSSTLAGYCLISNTQQKKKQNISFFASTWSENKRELTYRSGSAAISNINTRILLILLIHIIYFQYKICWSIRRILNRLMFHYYIIPIKGYWHNSLKAFVYMNNNRWQ